MTDAAQKHRSERGTALILAMVFLLAVGLVIIATANFAVNASVNTVNARGEQATIANAEAEASAAMQAIRTAYFYPGCDAGTCPKIYNSLTPTSYSCTPPGVVSSLEVNCIGSGGSAENQAARTVDFYVCQSAASGGPADCAAAAASSKVLLFAQAQYLDLPAGETSTDNQCTATSTATCGLTLSVTAWDVRLADS